MASATLDDRVKPKENPNLRWLSVIQAAALIGAFGVTFVTRRDDIARKKFETQYGTQKYIQDVNGDGIYENVVKLRNPESGITEQRILEYRNGELVLRKYEVKGGKIIYLD